jgi:hypothetical protein
MSYPLPSRFDSARSLYKQAMFLYKEYERMKKLNEIWWYCFYNCPRRVICHMEDNRHRCEFLPKKFKR